MRTGFKKCEISRRQVTGRAKNATLCASVQITYFFNCQQNRFRIGSYHDYQVPAYIFPISYNGQEKGGGTCETNDVYRDNALSVSACITRSGRRCSTGGLRVQCSSIERSLSDWQRQGFQKSP